ncbi:unnamed protein product [Rhizoctonia solani]|uniref:Uncharacterized protein n=1 Tax=Rhizoctonia solani TaxID=456999 RepID=A0A8H3C9C4_9AGAM|nr:unnamed protein product [Rhizoctonia solani]
MTAFPRAVFSGKELEVVRWFAGLCGVSGLPTSMSIQTRFESILKMLGLESRLIQSKLGNYFAINSVKSIIANEMSNPLVRKDMVFYPQDDGQALKQAANGARWTKEVNASLAAPMVRKHLPHGHQDYYIYEPFLTSSIPAGEQNANLPCAFIPVRYFQRNGTCFAKAHPLVSHEHGYIIDASAHVDISVSQFLIPLPEFRLKHNDYGLSSPNSILGGVVQH